MVFRSCDHGPPPSNPATASSPTRPPLNAVMNGAHPSHAHSTDTVIIGTGPAALLLSYLLNGHQPHLADGVSHPDPQLQAKLAAVPSLLDANLQQLTAHFPASRFSYSTQALPVNTLFDTLLRPLGDTAPGLHQSCIQWRQTHRTVPHIVLGLATAAGGQWQEDLVPSSAEISALSYADLLTLPGYTLPEYLHERGIHDDMDFLRPTRRDVAAYLAKWPYKVGIQSSLWLGHAAQGVKRTEDNGFYIASHHLQCRRLVLATGTFSALVPPPGLLQPLLSRRPNPTIKEQAPLLVIGSGFSAADIILTALLGKRRVLHLYNWDFSDVSSPLRACHASAYPEYAAIFRRMKRAANESLDLLEGSHNVDRRPLRRRKSSAYALERPEWDVLYEGIPNSTIQNIDVGSDNTSAIITLQLASGVLIERHVSELQYAVGRRGSLTYLNSGIRAELLGNSAPSEAVTIGKPIQARLFRNKVEQSSTFELASNVYIIGSLLGDSLVRHAYGGCFVVARELLDRRPIDKVPDCPMSNKQSVQQETSKENRPIKAASLEVAEAVAFALTGNKPPAIKPATTSRSQPSRSLDESISNTGASPYDQVPISLEFSEPPFPNWVAFDTYVANEHLEKHNDHEHLGDARNAILGSHPMAWGECSQQDGTTVGKHQCSGEEVAAF